jgi:DNA-binding IclR family transcriptional regulator
VGAAIAQTPRSADEVAAAFTKVNKDLVTRHLETLAMMGEIVRDETGRYAMPRKVA